MSERLIIPSLESSVDSFLTSGTGKGSTSIFLSAPALRQRLSGQIKRGVTHQKVIVNTPSFYYLSCSTLSKNNTSPDAPESFREPRGCRAPSDFWTHQQADLHQSTISRLR